MFKKTISKILPKNQFARGVGVLIGGTVGAQALMVFISPLLTRLYSPSDFGLLTIYMGLLSLFTVISSLRYQLAIPLPESDEEAALITLLSLFVVLCISLLSSLIVLFAGAELAKLFKMPQMTKYMWLLPIGILFGGGYQVFHYWAIRTKSFSNIANTKITQSFASAFIQLAAFKLGGLALLLGQAAGQGVGTTTLMRSFLSTKLYQHWTWSGLRRVAVRYKDFPLFSTWSGFFNTAGSHFLLCYLLPYFHPELLGYML